MVFLKVCNIMTNILNKICKKDSYNAYYSYTYLYICLKITVWPTIHKWSYCDYSFVRVSSDCCYYLLFNTCTSVWVYVLWSHKVTEEELLLQINSVRPGSPLTRRTPRVTTWDDNSPSSRIVIDHSPSSIPTQVRV